MPYEELCATLHRSKKSIQNKAQSIGAKRENIDYRYTESGERYKIIKKPLRILKKEREERAKRALELIKEKKKKFPSKLDESLEIIRYSQHHYIPGETTNQIIYRNAKSE